MTEQQPETLTEPDFLRLDGQICFALNAASRAFGGLYRVVLKDLGLTYPQYLVMLVLWEHGTTPVKQLGERLRLDSGTLSPLLKRLEAAGLIRRERSTEDERSVHAVLTDEGAALRARAVAVPRRIAAATGFELGEIRDLQARLSRLTEALDTAAASDTIVDGATDAGHGADTANAGTTGTTGNTGNTGNTDAPGA